MAQFRLFSGRGWGGDPATQRRGLVMADRREETHGAGPVREGEVLLRLRSGVVSAKRIRFSDHMGEAFFEGDIKLGKSATIRNSMPPIPPAVADREQKGLGIRGEGFRWPNRTVRYRFEEGCPDPQRLARHRCDQALDGKDANQVRGDRRRIGRLCSVLRPRRLLVVGRQAGGKAGAVAGHRVQHRQRDPRDRSRHRPLA